MLKLGLSLSFFKYFAESFQPLDTDPAHLLAQLLDQLIALGDMARQLSEAFGGNGHRPEKAVDLIQQLVNEEN